MVDFDMRPVKAAARKMLPADHPLREVLTGCPDHLSPDEAPATIASYYRMARALRRGR
jgi:hypothetical protein